MFTRLIRKISLLLNPPKKGDTFYGDSVWWIIPRPVELILHGLKDKYGNNLYDPIPSGDCFRLTITNTSMDSYYVLDSEVFCRSKNSKPIYQCDIRGISDIGVWMKRTQPRRMSKKSLEQFVLAGMLRKNND